MDVDDTETGGEGEPFLPDPATAKRLKKKRRRGTTIEDSSGDDKPQATAQPTERKRKPAPLVLEGMS